MTAAAEILVLGSVNRDLIVHAPRLPLPGETLRGQRFGSCLGGKGANQSVAAARLGARVALAARVGLLENGAAMVEQLKGEGVDTRAVAQPADEVPGVALIVVGAEDAENQIVTVAGSNGRLPLSQVEALDVAGLRWLVAQQELPLESVARAFERAHAAGVQTLRAKGPSAVLVSLGAAGLCWVDAEGTRRVPARAVKAVDTVGAGDTLVGALVTALAVSRPGVQDAMPRCDEV